MRLFLVQVEGKQAGRLVPFSSTLVKLVSKKAIEQEIEAQQYKKVNKGKQTGSSIVTLSILVVPGLFDKNHNNMLSFMRTDSASHSNSSTSSSESKDRSDNSHGRRHSLGYVSVRICCYLS